MKKLFHSCTALLLALCLVLGLGAVAASAAETKDVSKQDIAEWVKEVLAELSAVEVREDLTADNLEKLIREVVAKADANDHILGLDGRHIAIKTGKQVVGIIAIDGDIHALPTCRQSFGHLRRIAMQRICTYATTYRRAEEAYALLRR